MTLNLTDTALRLCFRAMNLQTLRIAVFLEGQTAAMVHYIALSAPNTGERLSLVDHSIIPPRITRYMVVRRHWVLHSLNGQPETTDVELTVRTIKD